MKCQKAGEERLEIKIESPDTDREIIHKAFRKAQTNKKGQNKTETGNGARPAKNSSLLLLGSV